MVLPAPMPRKNLVFPVLALALAAGLGGCRPPGGPVDLRPGVEASRDGRWDEAVALWTQAAAADPSSAAVHNNLAVAFERLGRFAEARAEYEAALKLAPGNARIRENFRRFQEARQAAPDKSGGPKGRP